MLRSSRWKLSPSRGSHWLLPLTGITLAAAGAAAAVQAPDMVDPGVLPPPPREFRGVWVATVDNIDWPSKPGLPVEQQKAEINAILDRCARLNLNAVIFQVRPACDALYESKLEPWSEYLTGRQGKAPQPYYDPLATWIEEAHRRGIELHAWFNPYRALHPSAKGPLAPTHVSKKRPQLVKSYGKHLWMDPSEKAVQDHSLAVIRDVVRRYDLDGVHIDDYFYPYKEKDSAGNTIPFPDEPSWQKYRKSGGRLNRDDWRRDSVNQFVKRLYQAIKDEKKHVRFGISPFGIWRPGYPASVKGLDQYSELYADARKWLVEGWVDYYTPQLYWKVSAPNQSYPALLRWWVEQNGKGRNIWPGNFTSRVTMGTWPSSEITEQIQLTRAQQGATGNVHFSMKALKDPGLGGSLQTLYGTRALVPGSPWLGDARPPQPRLEAGRDQSGGRFLTWNPGRSDQEPWLWVVRVRSGGQWTTEIVPGWERARSRVGGKTVSEGDLAALTAIDRLGNESKAVAVSLR